MTATVFRQSYMTQRPSLFTLINYCAFVFSFALMFANGWFTACDGFYDASACWLSHMKQLTIVWTVSSSIGWWVMAFNSIGWWVMAFSQYGEGYLLPVLFVFFKFVFLSHNFRSKNAKKLIKGSNDLNYSLVSSKTLSQKIGSSLWSPGPYDLGQNAWTYPHYDVIHKKTKP